MIITLYKEIRKEQIKYCRFIKFNVTMKNKLILNDYDFNKFKSYINKMNCLCKNFNTDFKPNNKEGIIFKHLLITNIKLLISYMEDYKVMNIWNNHFVSLQSNEEDIKSITTGIANYILDYMKIEGGV